MQVVIYLLVAAAAFALGGVLGGAAGALLRGAMGGKAPSKPVAASGQAKGPTVPDQLGAVLMDKVQHRAAMAADAHLEQLAGKIVPGPAPTAPGA